MCVCVSVCFFKSCLVFLLLAWLTLPWPSWRVDLVTTAATAKLEAAAVSTRVLDNQHACFIVSSSSRLRPSLLFSSLLFHLALALTVSLSLSLSLSLSCAPSFARARESFVRLGNAQTRRQTRGPGFVVFGEFWQCGDKKKNPCQRILQRNTRHILTNLFLEYSPYFDEFVFRIRQIYTFSSSSRSPELGRKLIKTRQI